MSKRATNLLVWTCCAVILPAALVHAETPAGLPGEPRAAKAETSAPWHSRAVLEAEKLSLAAAIMAERQRLAGRSFDEEWAERWTRRLAKRDAGELRRMLEALYAGEAPPLKAIGDFTRDLVFTPLDTSCLVLDTRSDDFAGNVPVDFEYAFSVAGQLREVFNQGGAANCGVPFGVAVAVTANVIAVDPSGKGNMQVWNWASGMKGNSVINFGGPQNNENLINGIMIPICNPEVDICEFDLNAEVNFTNSDIVFNVTGYFSPPGITELECQTMRTTQMHTGSFDFESPPCLYEYTLTGGGHNWSYYGSTDVWFHEVQPNSFGDAYRCRGNVDLGGAPAEITCTARCCLLPGF